MTPIPQRLEHPSVPSRRVILPLAHHLDVNLVTPFLLHQLGCDGWHAACRHEHQLVVQLTRGNVARYSVAYDCTPAVEKGIYHGSRAWALTLIPMHGEDNLTESKVGQIKAGLAGLHG